MYLIYFIFRKQCINETEEFDFLKDIVANVEDSPAAVSTQNDEAKSSNESKDSLVENVQENPAAALDEDSSKTQNHKCSISTMLNDDPVTPPHNRTADVDLSEFNESASSNLDEKSS